MEIRKQRDIFLTTCLLESIEDQNYRNTRKLLVEHHADPNLLIPESNIAPIHYAAGMENTAFAEAAMKLILKYNGNANVQTIDGETPLHIAVIWNRTLIVEMLLDHGADISIKDNENNTAINHFITERHYNLIPIFQNHVFEKKLQKKIDTTKTPSNSPLKGNPKKAIDKVIKSFERLEIDKSSKSEQFLTPNRTNYNFKEASPFFVNINQRPRRKRYKETCALIKENLNSKHTNSETNVNECDRQNAKSVIEIIEISHSDDNENGNDENDMQRDQELMKNLFELTEENIEKHLAAVIIRRRKDSLINAWRSKVNESRQRKSILPTNEDEIEAFLSKHPAESKPQSIESSSQQSGETVVAVVNVRRAQHDQNETEESFITAPDIVNNVNSRTFVIERDLTEKKEQTIDPENETAIILQTQEVYEHFDPDDNILFYENKLLANPMKTMPKSSTNNDVIVLNTSSESGTCTDIMVPSDYDTDDLRKELRHYGDVPGPITRNTKRLYLKRLIRYKRRQKQTSNNFEHAKNCNFSVELQRTMKSDLVSLDFINEYGSLERQMANGFQSSAAKNVREGNFKKSFNYLLIDPRIAENLLVDAQIICQSELWHRFLKSIFYVGKGKSSRPYAHLYDAIKLYRDGGNSIPNEKISKYQESLKLDRIIEIWRSNKGVICLPVFHNIKPIEAYTREAAMIDCLGVENLTNIKRGDYYGIVKSWKMRDRKRLGVLLLYKAMQVFMVEGESQLRPNDIK